MNTRSKKTFLALAIVFTVVCVSLFIFFYNEAKNIAITKLNEEQTIHAKQAARGIEDFFAMWTRNLTSLSKMDEIIDTDAIGKRSMELFYEANQAQIKSITRLDEKGIIIYNYPQTSFVGTDISGQKHIGELLRDHKPVISDVFRAVEGFDAIAMHVPAFKGGVFKGTIGILIDFKSIAKQYLDVIKIGQTGYAWVISRDGTQLYSPIPGFTGKSVFENTKGYASLISMEKEMVRGHEGAAIYTFDRIGERNVGQTRKYGVYMPIHIGNTFWSISVTSAEQDVLSGLIAFRNKLAFVIGAIFICGIVLFLLSLLKAMNNITELKQVLAARMQAEEALRESEEKFRRIVETANEGVLFAGTDGKMDFVNKKMADMLGYTVEEMICKTGLVFMPADQKEKVLANRSKLAAKNQIQDEFCFLRKDGSLLWTIGSTSPIFNDEGDHIGNLAMHTDITARKQRERELEKLNHSLIKARNDLAENEIKLQHRAEELTIANKELESFSYSLSHDMRAPIRAIKSFSAFLLKDYRDNLDAKGQEFLKFIDSGADKMNALIDDMLNLAKISVQEMSTREIDLCAIATAVFNDLRRAEPERKVDVIITREVKTYGDPRLMNIALFNLFGNAWKYSSKTSDARIEFGVMEKPGGRVYYARDNGVGFDMTQVHRLFTPFQRLHAESQFPGTGIGLAIVNRVIQRHGGRIWAESEIGKGATFFFS